MKHMRTALVAALVLVAVAFSIGAGDIGGIAVPGEITTPEGTEQPRIEIAGGYLRVMPMDMCPSCSVFTDRPFLASSINEDEKTIYTSMGLINESGVGAVAGATVFVYVERPDGEVVQRCRVYTGEDGSASFNYGTLCDDGCTIRMVFCCSNPVELACVLSTCLGDPVGAYTDLPACSGYEGAWPDKATVDGADVELYPTIDVVTIPPKVEAPGFTFAFTLCFPLLVIFGFLGAAMYAAGRDPFAMFSFYTPRFTRGGERPIGGKGYTLPGSSIGMVAMRVKDLASGASNLGDFVEMMRQSPLLQKGEGRVSMAAGTGRAAGRGGAAQETGMTAGEARAMGMPVVGGFSAGAAPELMPTGGSMAGIGVGTAFMALLGIFLRFSNAPWITGGLSQVALDLAKEWQQERLANFAQQNVGRLIEGMDVRLDGAGNVSRIIYTDTETGERVTVDGKEKCAEFIENNIRAPIASLQSVNANRAAELYRDYNRTVSASDPIEGARGMLGAERAAGGLPAGADSALAALADPNTSMADKQAAFEALSGMDWSGKPDVLIAAFVAATDGMTYTQFSDFVKGNEAAGALFRDLSVDAFNLRGSGDGNMLAAIAMASERLENIRDGRAQGIRDTLNLGGVVVALNEGVANCSGETFAFRAGTEEGASRMAAMGLSNAALDVRVSLEGINLERGFSPEIIEEIEAATHDGQVNVSELSADARAAIVQVAGSQLGEDAARGLSEAMGRYSGFSQLSYGMMMDAAGPTMEAAREASGVSGILGPNGELAGLERPEGVDSNKALEILRAGGVDPDLARTLSEVGRVGAEGVYIDHLGEIAREALVPADPAARLSQLPENLESNAESMEQYGATLERAVAILEDPLATEASRAWANGQLEGTIRHLTGMPEGEELPPEMITMFVPIIRQQADAMFGQADELHRQQETWETARAFAAAAPAGVDVTASPQEMAEQLRAANPDEVTAFRNAAREYAAAVGDDAGTAADRAAAHQAVETLRTSTDEAARLEAERLLQGLGVRDAYLEPLAHPPAGSAANRDAVVGAAATEAGSYIDQHYDSERAVRAAEHPEQAVATLMNGVSQDIASRRIEVLHPPEGEGAVEGLVQARLNLEETQFRDNELHVALLGNSAINDFYSNMDRNMELARETEQRIHEETERRGRVAEASAGGGTTGSGGTPPS